MTKQCPCPVHNENTYIQVFQFTSQLMTGTIRVSHGLNTGKGKESKVRWNKAGIWLFFELFALPASARFLILPVEDHHLQCDKLVAPGAFFPFDSVSDTCKVICLPCMLIVTKQMGWTELPRSLRAFSRAKAYVSASIISTAAPNQS